MLAWLARRLTLPFRRARLDARIRRELDFHLAMETERRQREGMNPADARRTALRDFGGEARATEGIHDVRGLTFWDALGQDVRFGWRALRRSPGYTAATILILALGVGANTAVFAVIDGVLLKPLPFRDGDELVLVQHSAPASGVADAGVSIPELGGYRARLASVRDLVEYHSMSFTLLNQGEPDRVDTGVVSANFFDMLGIRPLYGRTFIDTDDDLGSDAVLVLSHAYWRQKFGGDPGVVGRVLAMNNRPHTVVGVLPEYPQYPRENDVYMPTSACPFRAAAERTRQGGQRAFAALQVFGRLAPGRTIDQATAEIAGIAPTFERDFAADYERAGTKGLAGRAESLRAELVADARPLLFALMGTTALVLIVACANVANLALSRTLGRARELALRSALGAGPGRLLRYLLTESLMLAMASGAVGLLMASAVLDLLKAFIGRFTTRTTHIEVDGGVLLFALAASMATTVVFGVLPALAVRRNLTPAMRDGAAQSGDAPGRRTIRAILVVAQVAVSCVLLVGAAMLLQSFYRLSSVPLGYRTDRVMSAAIFGNFTRMSTPADTIRIQSAILERLRSAPGIRSAALTNAVPQSDIQPGLRPVVIEGRANASGTPEADLNIASDRYFETLGVPILAGRDFRRGDTAEAPPVAIVNATMATFWNGRDPVGSRFMVQGPAEPIWLTVVGVAADFRLYGADREVEAQFYIPHLQAGGGGARLVVSGDLDAAALASTIKTAVHAVDPQIPVEEIRTLDELRQSRLSPARLTTVLLSLFAFVALATTLAGVAGVIGASVTQRTREFGVRLALGASPGSVQRLVLGQGLWLVALGLALGLAGAYAFSRAIGRFLFETRPTDPAAYAAVALLFLVCAVAATLAPARRAMCVDPLTAVRSE